MPYFTLHEWQGYTIKLIPRDYTRNIIRLFTMRRDIVPYFYGAICFDLGITSPAAKIQAGKGIEYEWRLLRSKDAQPLKNGHGAAPLAHSTPFILERSKPSEVTHYSLVFGPLRPIRQISAVDLGHMSILDQYRIDMRFRENTGSFSDYVTMLEFTLKDRDDFYQNIWLLVIGGWIGFGFAAIAGLVGYMLGGK